jgi:hypothetical protein
MADKKIGDTVRGITRKALSGGKIDRAALRRVSAELRRNLEHFEGQLARDLRAASRAGRDAATQSVSATLASGATMARMASGVLAGIADSLARAPQARGKRKR